MLDFWLQEGQILEHNLNMQVSKNQKFKNPLFGGRPFVLCPETSDEKVTTGKMGYGQ